MVRLKVIRGGRIWGEDEEVGLSSLQGGDREGWVVKAREHPKRCINGADEKDQKEKQKKKPENLVEKYALT